MSDFVQTVFLAGLLIISLGFILFRLTSRTKALLLNKTPSCHGDGDTSCNHCHPKKTVS